MFQIKIYIQFKYLKKYIPNKILYIYLGSFKILKKYFFLLVYIYIYISDEQNFELEVLATFLNSEFVIII